jgi:hypothetical protein
MEPSIAFAVLAAYFLVSAETYLATHAAGVFRLSFGGIGPTELRILVAAGAFYAASHPWVELAGFQVRLLDASGLCAIAGLVAVFLVSAIRNTRSLYRAEPLPRRPAPDPASRAFISAPAVFTSSKPQHVGFDGSGGVSQKASAS